MMNELIEKLVADKGTDMAKDLVAKVGLSEEQASKFVGPAVTFLVGWVGKKLASGEDVDDVTVPEEEVQAVAAEAGIPSGLASSALTRMLPAVLGAAKEESGGLGAIASLLGGGSDDSSDGSSGGLGALSGMLKGL